MKIPIVSSTHWDREWRFSFQQSRWMLVELMDHLIDILKNNPDFRCYHLDAQTVVLEDYLAVRPEKYNELENFIRQGRIIAGPWYTLPDMCSIGGEAIIRNLLTGHRVARKFGRVMKAGYTPTGFGQIAQLPQIYAGFGISTVLFYRGADRTVLKKEFLWEAPDGTKAAAYIFTPEFGRMPLFHMIASNYYRGKSFYDRECIWEAGEGAIRINDERRWKDLYFQSHPNEGTNIKSLKENIKRLIDVEMKDSVLDTFLLLDGVDSTEPRSLLVNLIEDMNRTVAEDNITFYHADMEEFAAELENAAPGLPVYGGEMRASAKYGVQVNLMGAAISSRIYLKLMNDSAERKLVNWAEPFSTFAWTLGAEYPVAFFETAWEYLLWNQSHDSIAGCGMDIVHQDMEYYFRQCEEISDTLTTNALLYITKNLSGEAFDKDDILLIVYNPLPCLRNGMVETFVDIPEKTDCYIMIIEDTAGKKMQVHTVSGPDAHPVLVHRPLDVPGLYRMKRMKICFFAEDVPACGYKVFLVKDAVTAGDTDTPEDTTPESIKTKEDIDKHDYTVNELQNEFMSVRVSESGTFDVTDLTTGYTYRNLNMFEDGGEAGDPWTRAAPAADTIIRGPASAPFVSSVQNCLSGSITVSFSMAVPVESDSAARSACVANLDIVTVATLGRGNRWLEFRTKVINHATDHRLRVVFPSGLDTEYSYAGAPFEIMKRDIKTGDTSGWFEKGYTTYPQREFSAVTDGKNGLAVLNRGLPEYEVIDDEMRTIAVTLLRCYKMRLPKLKTIDNEQQGSQCLGERIFEYAVCPFGGLSVIDVLEYASMYRLPMKTAQCSKQQGILPDKFSFIEVGKPFVLYAIKKAEDRDTIVLRVFNPEQEETGGWIRFHKPVSSAYLLDMEENRLGKMDVTEKTIINLKLKTKKIITLELEFRQQL